MYRTSFLLSTLLISACATPSDPCAVADQGGFLGVLQSEVTGAYNACLSERTAELEQTKQSKQAAEERYKVLSATETELQVQRRQLAQEVEAVHAETQRLEREVANQRATSAKKKQEKAALEKRLANLKAQSRKLQQTTAISAMTPAEIAAKKREAAALQKEIDDLWTIINSQ